MPDVDTNPMISQLEEITSLLRELVRKERPKPQRLLRISEAAHYLHISVGQLRGLVQRGEIPIVRQSDGNRIPWLIDTRDCDAWIERAKTSY